MRKKVWIALIIVCMMCSLLCGCDILKDNNAGKYTKVNIDKHTVDIDKRTVDIGNCINDFEKNTVEVIDE